jgi:hypothetical protein
MSKTRTVKLRKGPTSRRIITAQKGGKTSTLNFKVGKDGITLTKNVGARAYDLKTQKIKRSMQKQVQKTKRLETRYKDNILYAGGKGVGAATMPAATAYGESKTASASANVGAAMMRRANYGSPDDVNDMDDSNSSSYDTNGRSNYNAPA